MDTCPAAVLFPVHHQLAPQSPGSSKLLAVRRGERGRPELLVFTQWDPSSSMVEIQGTHDSETATRPAVVQQGWEADPVGGLGDGD